MQGAGGVERGGGSMGGTEGYSRQGSVWRIRGGALTEFGGVPTLTACAVGPWWSDEVDRITGHLKLL